MKCDCCGEDIKGKPNNCCDECKQDMQMMAEDDTEDDDEEDD